VGEAKRRDIDFDAALAELPIFPLPQVVLFPNALLPLHVFEPRYRALLKDCLATHKAMAMALIVDHEDRDAHGHPRIAPIAGVGFILEHQTLPDGRSSVLLHGRGRVRLEELPFVPPYRRARATLIADSTTAPSAEDKSALFATAGAFVADVRKRDPGFSLQLPQNIAPGALADLCAHHLVIDARARQAILEQGDPAERVRMVTAELVAQHALVARESGGMLH
jgi:Lon protease-like protein